MTMDCSCNICWACKPGGVYQVCEDSGRPISSDGGMAEYCGAFSPDGGCKVLVYPHESRDLAIEFHNLKDCDCADLEHFATKQMWEGFCAEMINTQNGETSVLWEYKAGFTPKRT